MPLIPTEVGRAYLAYRDAEEMVNAFTADMEAGRDGGDLYAATVILGYSIEVLRGLGAADLIACEAEDGC